MSAYEKIFTSKNLRDVWKKLYSDTKPTSRDTVGTDGQSINTFQADLPNRLREVHSELNQRRFTFDPLRPLLIPKDNGTDRLICIPTVKSRLVQRALVNHVATKYHAKLANEISYGFIRTRNVHDAAKKAVAMRQKDQWVFKTDITSFFDKIRREDIAQAIRKEIRESSLPP